MEEEKLEYFEEIKDYYKNTFDTELNQEEQEIIKKLLDNEWVQLIYSAGFNNGYDAH